MWSRGQNSLNAVHFTGKDGNIWIWPPLFKWEVSYLDDCSVKRHMWSVWPITGSCGGAHLLGLLQEGREQEGSWGRTSTEPRWAPYFLGSAAPGLRLVGEMSLWWERSGQQELPAQLRVELEATAKRYSRCLKEEESMSEWMSYPRCGLGASCYFYHSVSFSWVELPPAQHWWWCLEV